MASRASGCRKAARPGSSSTTRPPRAARRARPPSPAPASEVESKPAARHRDRLRRGSRLIGEVAGPQQHRVADRLGQRHVGVERQLEAGRRPIADALRTRSAAGELLDEERDAAGAVVQHRREPGRHGRRRAPAPARAVVPCALSGCERQLAAAGGCGAGRRAAACSWWVARDLVRSIRSRLRAWQLAQRSGEPGEQLERRRVGPLEVVEEHRPPGGRRPRRPVRSGSPRTASRDRSPWLGAPSSGRSSARCGRRGPQRESPPGTARRKAAQGRDHRLVGERARGRGAAQEPHVGRRRPTSSTKRVLPTPASPASRTSEPRPSRASVERDLEPGPLGFALDQRAEVHAAQSSGD